MFVFRKENITCPWIYLLFLLLFTWIYLHFALYVHEMYFSFMKQIKKTREKWYKLKFIEDYKLNKS